MSHSKSRRAKERRQEAKRQRADLSAKELMAIIERSAQGALSAEDQTTLKTVAETLAFITEELRSKKTSIERLRRLLFGPKTEKTRKLLGEEADSNAGEQKKPGAQGEKPAGHGRRPAAAYVGAKRVKVPHPTLHTGECCPECIKGRIYPVAEPAKLVRITGVAPLSATVYERDRMRCNLCGEVFTAPPPEGVGEKKYDEQATATVGMCKYGAGLPFNRIEKLQEGMGVPLPAATQWELVSNASEALEPAHEELIRQAAQGQVLHNDDTTMRVLDLTAEQRAAAAADEQTDERTGVFTSGIVSTVDRHRVALFFTGAKHAGENLADVLARRAEGLPPPIQMCDALAANTKGEFEAIVAHCIAHARRRYADVVDDFPEQVRHVLETLRGVYRNDALARDKGLTGEERLRFHQSESRPLMDQLESWMREQFAERKVEPNSGLGQAIRYMQKHWQELTLFLRVADAPLDNNVCERSLKKAILHRKNALFYKTLEGARVGDIFMSLIHTAELNDVSPFEYLVALLRNAVLVAEAPGDWMPWSIEQTLARMRATSAPASQ